MEDRKFKSNKKIIFVSITIIFVVLILFLNTKYKGKDIKNINVLKCPESYTTNEERNEANSIWIEKENETNPNLIPYDLYSNRYDFLIKNNCVETLKSLHNDYGLNATKEDIVNSEVEELRNSGQNILYL